MGIFVGLRGMLGDSKVAKAFRGFGTPRPMPAVLVDDQGLSLVLDPAASDEIIPAISWSDVRRVTAFKRDLFSVDLVCLRFDGPDDQVCEVNEEMAGWAELLDALPEHLPGCVTKNDILEQAVLPAFATNETVVYRRSTP